MLAPVEYLTYEIRDIFDLMRLIGGDAHIDPHPLAWAVHPISPQSISTTSPVYLIRICIAFFVDLKYAIAQTKPRE